MQWQFVVVIFIVLCGQVATEACCGTELSELKGDVFWGYWESEQQHLNTARAWTQDGSYDCNSGPVSSYC